MAENIENSAAQSMGKSSSGGFAKDIVKTLFLGNMVGGGRGGDSSDTGSNSGGGKVGRQFRDRSAAYAKDLESHANYLERVSGIGQTDRTHAAETLKDLAEHGHILSEGAANNAFMRTESAKNNAIYRGRRPATRRAPARKPGARAAVSSSTKEETPAAKAPATRAPRSKVTTEDRPANPRGKGYTTDIKFNTDKQK